MRKNLIYIVLLFGFIGVAQENPISIETDTTTIKIGEQIQFKIKVDEINNVVFPKLQLDSLGKVEVIESLPIDTLKNRLEKKYLLTSFDSGHYVLPKQLVLINNKQFFTDSLLVNVATVKVDTLKQKMFPIKSIKKEPKTFDDYKYLLWWLIPILILLAVILYFIFRKKEKKEVPKVIIAPIQEALQRLKELDDKQLPQQNKVKIYYSELTDIVRTYIEKDINIPALESTTNELIETISDFNESSKLGISKEIIQQLKEVLQSADLVKFAKSKPIIDEIKRDRTAVEDILKNTQHAVHINDEKVENDELNEEIFIQNKPKKNNLVKYILIFIGVFIIGIGVAGYFGYSYIKDKFIGNTTSEMIDKQWYTSTYGYPSVSIETPEILQAQSLEIPENLKSIIEDVTTYNYGSLISNFYIEVTTTSFVNELENFDYEAGIQASLQQMAQKAGINFTDLQEEIRLNNGIEGRIITANYELKNEVTQQLNSNKLTLLFFVDTKNIRQIIITQLASDENAEQVSERIIKSVSLNP
ncbi:hypothetical protein [uncultured Lutibacter sp.]|uniref:hypothetical protein n=1 Tax=uncultured Lutibacter sp. TaxID=437739 RepID=UPI00262A2C4C|nr:hypothetical protein [uncultured Lutibacter sp.]